MRFSRILVVDDSATSRLIVRRCFEMAGYSDATFVESPDGAAALDLLRTSPFDLVVTDLKMPRVDGVTLVAKMRASSYATRTPVVVISSVAHATNNEAALRDKVLAVVQKPLSPAKLIHALEKE